MFEITAENIALLNDEDLRSLVGRLCEAEVRRHGFSTSCVTWGGDQNAKDGGVDVRVALPGDPEIGGFVPRPATVFQVKKSAMSRADILSEMCPHEILRPAIRDLADRSGAYIILSSGASISETSLQNRRAAMKEAVENLPNAPALGLDFYDSGRVATWIRDHLGLIPWVREKIGTPLRGWRPYPAWACAPEGLSEEYLLDDKIRVRTDTEIREGGFQLLDGIHRIRERLRHPAEVVRLVGLSGVGKTRLAQALFDYRVGVQSLDPSIAAYTDMADEPEPHPTAVCSDLISSRTKAILVIDNCPADLHRRLSELCRVPESLVSVITVEYDIRDDQPEGTEVFELEPASTDLIEKLVKRRFTQLSPVDLRTIAEFSGGNSRIAIALSETLGRQDTIAGMSDDDLFKRLFQQKHESSDSLLLAAQALSLVYSFQGEDISNGSEAELFRFAAVTGKNVQEIFQSAAELQRRGLIQKRGVWRAVLPQAIANRLAAGALQNIPSVTIEARLVDGAPERLALSFSRRLRYLDSSLEAKAVVKKWLGPGGRLANVAELDDLGSAILINIAPVAPEAVLAVLERALLQGDSLIRKCRRFIPVIRSLAYDPTLFERCIALILKIAESQDVVKDENDASRAFASLFPIYFSGTHATIDQRLSIVKSLICSDDPKQRSLGLMGLRASLEAVRFGPGYNFEFGARSRDYGYWPKTGDAVKEWFRRTLMLVEHLASPDEPWSSQVRAVLAVQFRGLWTVTTVHEDLERVCRAICKRRFWAGGWIAVRESLHYDSEGPSSEILTRLASLETLLRPRNLVQKVRSIVLSDAVTYVGLDSTYDGKSDVTKTLEQVESAAYDLGTAVAVDHDAFAELLPELIAGNSQQLWTFGSGLAKGSENPRAMWDQLAVHLANTPVDRRSPHVFRGFLNGLHGKNAKLVNALLDDALENETLGQWYPVLQIAVGIDKEGLTRLLRSLDLGIAWIGQYGNLVMGGVTHPIAGPDFNNLLRRIAGKNGGLEIAIEILCMRLLYDTERHSSTSEVIDIGCELMGQLKFDRKAHVRLEHRIGIVAKNCLVGERGAATIHEICRNLKAAILSGETSAFYQKELLQVLLGAQPVAVLTALCGNSIDDLKLGTRILDEAGQLGSNVFDAIPEDELLSWCDQQPEIRYPAAANGVSAFQHSRDTGRPEWTSTARKLLDKAPHPIEVLKKFIDKFSPSNWATSRASIVESNAKLLDDLAEYSDPAMRHFIATEKVRLSETIEVERQSETRIGIEIERDQRFE